MGQDLSNTIRVFIKKGNVNTETHVHNVKTHGEGHVKTEGWGECIYTPRKAEDCWQATKS